MAIAESETETKKEVSERAKKPKESKNIVRAKGTRNLHWTTDIIKLYMVTANETRNLHWTTGIFRSF